MLTRLAQHANTSPRLIAVIALVCLIAAGVIGGPAFGELNAPNSFQDPGSPSAQAQATLERVTGAEPTPGVLALVNAAPASPLVASAAQVIRATPGVARVSVPAPGALGAGRAQRSPVHRRGSAAGWGRR